MFKCSASGKIFEKWRLGIRTWSSAGRIAVLFGAEERFKQCAEGAERFFFQKLDPETAQNSLCKIAFFFTKHSIFRLRAKILKNGGEEFDPWSSGCRV